MFLVDNFKNAWSKVFNKHNIIDNNVIDVEKRSIGKTQEELDQVSGDGSGDLSSSQISFQEIFGNKKERIAFYKTMSMFPEITDALDNVCDETIIDNGDGEYIKLEMKKEMPKAIDKKIKKEFDYLMNSVFKFADRGWDLFRKWLVESELYLEVVLTKNKKSIGGLKVLPAHSMTPVYDGNKIVKYIQVLEGSQNQSNKGSQETTKYFEPNQILYINYGLYGKNLLDVRGFLEASIRPFNQLKSIEDSLVIYRLVRAPERRMWNIDIGKMPKGKSEEYIKKLISKYKKRLNYNSDTGAVNSSYAYQSMTEDFWFAKTENGGSNVETLQSGQNLGEIEDVKYFLKKLYKTLKLPRTRWEENANFSSGRMGEITREEVSFARFSARLQIRFKKLFMNSLITQLSLKGIDKKYLDPDNFSFKFVQSNLFKEYKERENMNSLIELYSSISSYVINPSNVEDGIFSVEYVLKNILKMSDDDYNLNKKLRMKEIKRLKIDYPVDDEEDEEDEEIEDNEPEDNEPEDNEPEDTGDDELDI